jgi:hypothetical protein
MERKYVWKVKNQFEVVEANKGTMK